MTPLISICIPTYNGAKYLHTVLESIKAQTYSNIEVIISDDNSQDDTLVICEAFKNEVSFPVFIFHHQPKGIGANWNHAIQKANGEYIKLLFQDDSMEPACLEILLQTLQKNQLDFVACKRNVIDSEGQIVVLANDDLQERIGLFYKEFALIDANNIFQFDFDKIRFNNFVGEPVVTLFSKKLYDTVGIFNEQSKQLLDYEYWLRVLKYFKIGLIGNKLINFRVHSEQTSAVNQRNKVNDMRVVDAIFLKYFKVFLKKNQIALLRYDNSGFWRYFYIIKKKLFNR